MEGEASSQPIKHLTILQVYSLPVIVVARLKCTKCGKTLDKKAITDYCATGVAGTRVGVGYDLLVWPFRMRVYATCPVCSEKGWLKVLPPWNKELSRLAVLRSGFGDMTLPHIDQQILFGGVSNFASLERQYARFSVQQLTFQKERDVAEFEA